MAATIAIIEGGRVHRPEDVERLWFFPNGSEYLRYSPHFHIIHPGGFRTNFPLTHGFVIVYDGKLSVKNFYGGTTERIDVHNGVWHFRGTKRKAQGVYANVLRGLIPPPYTNSTRRRNGRTRESAAR